MTGCTSIAQSHQFTAAACSTFAEPHDTTGPCAPNARQIANPGPVIWFTGDVSVAFVDNNGLVTAAQSGLTTVSARLARIVSSPVNFTSCMPIEIRLHVQGSPNESATMTPSQALTLQTDMTDANGTVTNNVSMLVASDYPTVASVAGLTVTANTIGGAGILAGCTPPICGKGLNTPVYSNLFPVSVPGTSPAPMVYASSSFTPPPGTSPYLLSIDSSTNPPTTGKIALPGVPNSMVFAANGAVAYLGTSAGLVKFTPSDNTVSFGNAGILGVVLAVSADGSIAIVSNAAADPEGNVIQPLASRQLVWAYLQQQPDVSLTQIVEERAVTAATINGDDFRMYLATNDGSGNVYAFSPLSDVQTINVAGGSGAGVAALPAGPFAYVANQGGLNFLSTCNDVQIDPLLNPPTHSNNLSFLQPVANANTIVAVDSPGVDVETADVTSILSGNPPLPYSFSSSNCEPNVSYSNQFIDFGIGSFTASYLAVASNGSRIVVIPAGSSKVLAAVPGPNPSVAAIPLAIGATQAFPGGLTPDGNTLWVGTAGPSPGVHEISLTSGSEVAQVATSFQQSNGNPAPADIVTMRPQ